jgi:hypothetical protein
MTTTRRTLIGAALATAVGPTLAIAAAALVDPIFAALDAQSRADSLEKDGYDRRTRMPQVRALGSVVMKFCGVSWWPSGGQERTSRLRRIPHLSGKLRPVVCLHDRPRPYLDEQLSELPASNKIRAVHSKGGAVARAPIFLCAACGEVKTQGNRESRVIASSIVAKVISISFPEPAKVPRFVRPDGHSYRRRQTANAWLCDPSAAQRRRASSSPDRASIADRVFQPRHRFAHVTPGEGRLARFTSALSEQQ